jgi:hypothetical protein
MAHHHGCSLAIDNCHKTPHKRREGDAWMNFIKRVDCWHSYVQMNWRTIE